MKLNQILNIEHPLILAPMFLVTNEEMVKIALDCGITAAIPALNYRKTVEMERAIRNIKDYSDKAFGINIIANKSNPLFRKQLKVALENGVGFIISSLGNPREVIEMSKKYNVKVFCDVVDIKYAIKAEQAGADALIAVNNCAGGHAGKYHPEEFTKSLIKNCNIPVIAAGGISTPEKYKDVLSWGAAGASVGTVFIASFESPVSNEYKQALINYTDKDIVFTSKLSGSPTTVINTEFVKKSGTKQSFLERLLNSNPYIKRSAKNIIMKRGMNKLRQAAFGTTYKNVWCAGPSIKDITEIRKLSEIIHSFTKVSG